MKKVLLFAAGVAMSLSAMAQDQTWAVVGAYTNPGWNFEASTVLTGTGDELSCTIEKLVGDFKIVNITNNNWDIQYGTSTPIEIGKTYKLDGKDGGADPANIKFAGMIQAVEFARVTFNTSTFELTVNAEPDDVVYGYPELFMTGSFCDWNAPGEGESVKADFDEATTTYTVKVNLGDSDKVEFKLAGTGWSNEIAGPTDNTVIGNEEATPVSAGGSNLVTYLTGEQTLTFNISTMLMTFGNPGLVSGVESVVAEEGAPVYFNLQGVRVNNPDKGIYIVKTGNKVNKVIVR